MGVDEVEGAEVVVLDEVPLQLGQEVGGVFPDEVGLERGSVSRVGDVGRLNQDGKVVGSCSFVRI